MGMLFTAADAFEIAIEIERNGAKFYRNAAERTEDESARHELLELAAMEDSHEVVFTQLMRGLVGENVDQTWFDPDSDAVQYLQNFAAGQVFDMTKDLSEQLEPKADLKAVLELALQRERDSVVFFLGIKEMVPSARGGIKIESIIKEEMSHIALISKRLTQVAF